MFLLKVGRDNWGTSCLLWQNKIGRHKALYTLVYWAEKRHASHLFLLLQDRQQIVLGQFCKLQNKKLLWVSFKKLCAPELFYVILVIQVVLIVVHLTDKTHMRGTVPWIKEQVARLVCVRKSTLVCKYLCCNEWVCKGAKGYFAKLLLVFKKQMSWEYRKRSMYQGVLETTYRHKPGFATECALISLGRLMLPTENIVARARRC